MRKTTTYLDNASTTPLDKRVLSVMLPYMTEKFGNPASLHSLGREAKEAVLKARGQIGAVLDCRPEEIIFTASATEADNLAILGVARANAAHGKRIIVSAIEHKGVLSACQVLEKEGFDVIYLPVDKNAQISLEQLKESLNDQTTLVSISMANNETGSIQPMAEIVRIIKKFRAVNSKSVEVPGRGLAQFPYFHTDASQTVGYQDVNVSKLSVDLLTCSAHKIGGPKGVALLYIKKGVAIQPLVHGGGQQKKIRSGTENVSAIVGFGQAMELASASCVDEMTRLAKLRNALEEGIVRKIEGTTVNGHPTDRLPNFSNISFRGVEGEALLLYLDEAGIMVSTGSACNSDSSEPSHVLSAMGLSEETIRGSIRFSLGKINTDKDVNRVLKDLPDIVKILRSNPSSTA